MIIKAHTFQESSMSDLEKSMNNWIKRNNITEKFGTNLFAFPFGKKALYIALVTYRVPVKSATKKPKRKIKQNTGKAK